MSHRFEPRFSILLPAYDAEQTLPACLKSLLRQRERRWECIVVDDGSTDGTLGVARQFAEKDPRIRLVARPHRGLVATLNSGIEHCRGGYVARMDADDVMHRDRLRAQGELLDKRLDLAGVGCHVRIFPRLGLADGTRAYERWLNGIDSAAAVRREAFVECPVAHPTLVVRRRFLLSSGYRDMGWAEDYDLILRLLAEGASIGVVPRRLLGWRDLPSRLSRTHDAYRIERFTACKAAFLADSFLADSERYILWGHGGTGRALRRALEAHARRPSHIVEVHPGRLGNVIHGAPVIEPRQLARIPRLPVVASVAGATAREQIRDTLKAMGFVESRDFVCAA